MQKNQMPNRDNPCCSVPQSCTHTTLHVQDLFVFLIGHGPVDESEEMPTCSSQVLSFTVHGSLPLSTGSALPLHHGKENDSFQVSSHMPIGGLQRALVQTLKLTMDVLLLHHGKGGGLPSTNTSVVLQNSPAFHPSCMVIQIITTLY